MNIRKFFFISLVLAIVAVGLHFVALKQYSHGSHVIALAVTMSGSEQATASLEAGRYTHRGGIIDYIGMAFAVVSAGFLIASERRHEPAWQSLPFALLGFYVILQFGFV